MPRKSYTAAAQAAPLPRGPRLPTSRMHDESFGFRTWEAIVLAGTPMERIVSGDFWRLNAHRIRPGDQIRWRDDSLTHFGELAVVACDVATGRMELRSLWHEVVPAVKAEESERNP